MSLSFGMATFNAAAFLCCMLTSTISGGLAATIVSVWIWTELNFKELKESVSCDSNVNTHFQPDTQTHIVKGKTRLPECPLMTIYEFVCLHSHVSTRVCRKNKPLLTICCIFHSHSLNSVTVAELTCRWSGPFVFVLQTLEKSTSVCRISFIRHFQGCC